MDFDAAFTFTVGVEGGLSLDPLDSGNWTGGKQGVGTLKGTKYGISAASYPMEDIANLTLERARQIYLVDFWGKAACDAVPDVIRLDLFDMAVNSGVGAAIRAVQTTAGTPADGVIGPQTLLAVSSMSQPRLVERFDAARLFHVTEMDADRFNRFGRGLVIRIAHAMLQGA